MVKTRKKSLEMRLASKNKTEFWEAVEEIKKDPQFLKEIDRFIKATTRVYKLE